VVSVAAHEMNCRQGQLLLATSAVPLVEVLGGPLHLDDSVLDDVIVLLVLVDFIVILLDRVHLLLQLRLKELLQHLETQVLFVSKDFENKQWRKDMLVTNEGQRFFDVPLRVTHVWQVSEVGERLNPEIAVQFFSRVSLIASSAAVVH